jgi:tetratricopeptide (TPR) repeat protein
MTNQFLSKTTTTFRYVNANDFNNNGRIDDVEFTEAEIIKDVRDVVFTNLNINIGISYQIGRTTRVPDPVPMISLEEEIPEDNKVKEAEPVGKEASETRPVETPAETGKAVDIKNDQVVTSNNNEAKPSGEGNAETSGYDESEARFLYKAGELYFQNNDFENAVACFNKIKNNPDHLMAKYMFALSLCEMMNCEEAASEYEKFDSLYKKDDAGILYTVYKSHYEKCRKDVIEQKALAEKMKLAEEAEAREKAARKAESNPASTEEKSGGKTQKSGGGSLNTEYKIQFVALRFSNKTFPRMENIGTIAHEFYPKKSMYRYTLGPYTSEDEAVSDMLKVRAMGFEDAFLAVYKNGKRTNTLYHAR